MSRRNGGQALGLVIQSLLYLEALGFAEFAAHYMSELTGVISHFVVLLVVLIVSAAARKESQRDLWLALGLVPLIRIASLAMLHVEISDIYWYLLISVPVLVGVVTLMRVLKYSSNTVGIRYSEPVIQALLVPFGIAVGVVDYMILKPDALNSSLSVESTLFPALILLISTGFVEELAFRGVMQRAAEAVHSWGWVYVAAIYAVIQIGRGSVQHAGLALAVGLVFGWVVKRTGSILGVGLAHGLLNIGLYLIFPHLF